MPDILVIDDLDRTLDLCRRTLPEYAFVGPARSWAEADALLRRLKGRVDVVLLDVCFDIPAEDLLGLPPEPSERAIEKLRRRQGLEILARLRKQAPDLPVILMTRRDDLPLEREAEMLDAQEYTYFLDDDQIDARALRAQIQGILHMRRGADRDGPIFWGRSLKMRRTRQRILTLSRGRLPIVIEGPTGTGKSLVARRFIHERSGRKGAFISVDLATLPRDLVAAHLFGSVKGAYTGSITDRKGAFESAHTGTLFLDEVGNLGEEAQRMLLTVLQEGVVTRLGDTVERQVDVKLVVATHENLAELVRRGRFRSDLYMRLNPACTVTLPALRDRLGDLEALLGFCVEQALGSSYLEGLVNDYLGRAGLSGARVQTVAGGEVPAKTSGVLQVLFSDQSMRLLKRHLWPGNLREFAMTVENALTFTLTELDGVLPGERADVIQVRPKLIRDLLRSVRTDVDEDEGGGWRTQVIIKPDETLNHVATAVERQYFATLYALQEGDFTGMARVLLGDASHARKIQLRFNQLGLRVRELKERIEGQQKARPVEREAED
jgi:DNA-binding NtrC family response regulator